MDQIVTAIEIEASTERVWQVLTDFPAYSQWNSAMWQIRGEAIPGTRLQVWVRFAPGITMSFRPKVLHAENGRELRWQGRLLRSRLFAGEHSFVIEPLGNGRVMFLQAEVYTGLLVPVILPLIGGSTRRVFEVMNRELKARAESILPDSV
jgi:hypothetical protein